MSPDALLMIVRKRAAAGEYVLSNEAIERARVAGHSPGDVRHALAHAVDCLAEGGGRWTVVGTSLDGTEMRVLVLVAAGGSDVTVV
ncbi:MAG: hypothetical protein JWM74_5392 [Myxococcaceae bacterium]|nr:hypothetical protein [Myxococcaceae bacterium]